MRRSLLVLLCMPLLAGPAAAQSTVQNCYGCVLGIYGDPALSSITGNIATGLPLDIYLGIKFDAFNAFNGLTGIECSISGLGQGLLLSSFEPLVPATVLGTPSAPADTSAGTSGTGGVNISWPTCLAGSQALVKLTLVATSEVSDRVLQVKAKYPTSNPTWHTPIFTQCDLWAFTATRVYAAFYCLNPGWSCPVHAVESSSWSSIKQLFR